MSTLRPIASHQRLLRWITEIGPANSVFCKPRIGAVSAEETAVLLSPGTPVPGQIWTSIPLDCKVEPVFHHLIYRGLWDWRSNLILLNMYCSRHYTYYVAITYFIVPFYLTRHERALANRINEAEDHPCCNLATETSNVGSLSSSSLHIKSSGTRSIRSPLNR